MRVGAEAQTSPHGMVYVWSVQLLTHACPGWFMRRARLHEPLNSSGCCPRSPVPPGEEDQHVKWIWKEHSFNKAASPTLFAHAARWAESLKPGFTCAEFRPALEAEHEVSRPPAVLLY